MKRKRLGAVLLALFLCVSCTAGAQQESQGLLYRVTKGENTLYVLGSIHIGNEEMLPFGGHILDAMEQSDLMVFECDTKSPEAVKATVSMMYQKAGTRTQDIVSPETWEAVSQACEKISYPLTAFAAMKPWAIVSTLTVYMTAELLGIPDIQSAMELGVEEQVYKQLEGIQKPVLYLESVEEQLGVMDGFSPELQEYLLKTTCDSVLQPSEVSASDATVAMWPEWWKNGDEKAFAQAYRADYEQEQQTALLEEYHDGLVTRRNIMMAERLDEMMKQHNGQTAFATIGLLHLVLEEDSVLTHLKGMGYTVERIINP